MHLVYKATYHDKQTSYNWQAHITDDFGNVVCGRKLNEFWDVYSEYFPSLEVVFQSHDPQGICANCRRSKRLTQRVPDAAQAAGESDKN